MPVLALYGVCVVFVFAPALYKQQREDLRFTPCARARRSRGPAPRPIQDPRPKPQAKPTAAAHREQGAQAKGSAAQPTAKRLHARTRRAIHRGGWCSAFPGSSRHGRPGGQSVIFLLIGSWQCVSRPFCLGGRLFLCAPSPSLPPPPAPPPPPRRPPPPPAPPPPTRSFWYFGLCF
jgi:hypothetical protein